MSQPAGLNDIHGVANVLNGLNCGEARPQETAAGPDISERSLCGGLRSAL
jgi:hypothetical protein